MAIVYDVTVSAYKTQEGRDLADICFRIGSDRAPRREKLGEKFKGMFSRSYEVREDKPDDYCN